MTASYAPEMRGGPSIGRGVQRVGSEGFQSDRPPSARTAMPDRSPAGGGVGIGNRGVTNMALAGGNRAGMGAGPSRFGNAGLFAHTNGGVGGFGGAGSGGFGHGNSFGSGGGSFNGGGSRFGGGNGFSGSGFGHGWNGGSGRWNSGYGHGGYGHGGYGHGYGRWGYGHGWGYGWGPGWGGWGGDGWWFLDDLFGLALNVTSFALNPWTPFATLGADLIGDGVQALGNLDSNNYGGDSGDQGSYGVYANDPGSYYNSDYTYPPYRQTYQPLCGTVDSAENPGCLQ